MWLSVNLVLLERGGGVCQGPCAREHGSVQNVRNPFAAASPRDSTLKKRKFTRGLEPHGEVKRFTAVGVTQG